PAEADWVQLARGAHREGVRLDRLVDQLLALSRMDGSAGDSGGSGDSDAVEQVDLDELVLAEVDAVRARGRVTVGLSPFSAVRLPGRAEQLCRVVRNLLDNAERHAERAVTVGLSAGSGFAELVVADDGTGVP